MSRKHRAPTSAKPSRTALGGPPLWDDPPAQPLDNDEDAALASCVVVTLLRHLRPWISPSLASDTDSRVAWFLSADDAELVELFDRFPERSMDQENARAILAGLRAFSVDQSDRLQRYFGATGSIQYGFHADATLEQVVESFEDDGFEVVDAIRGGRVVVSDEEGLLSE